MATNNTEERNQGQQDGQPSNSGQPKKPINQPGSESANQSQRQHRQGPDSAIKDDE